MADFWFWGFVFTYLYAGLNIARADMSKSDTPWTRLLITGLCVLLWPFLCTMTYRP